jgi:hypothetical protein
LVKEQFTSKGLCSAELVTISSLSITQGLWSKSGNKMQTYRTVGKIEHWRQSEQWRPFLFLPAAHGSPQDEAAQEGSSMSAMYAELHCSYIINNQSL